MDPLVSIITPTYNHEKFIGQCIESVIKQTFRDWEMIIVDDGSSDRTSEIIKQFSDPRIQYIRQEHLGPFKLGITYNKALALARGEFIAVLEGDDYWPSYKLEKQIPYFNNKDIILTYGKCPHVNKHNKIIMKEWKNSFTDDIRNNRPIGNIFKAFLTLQGFIWPVTVMIRRDALSKIGGFIHRPDIPCVDFMTWTRLALEGEFKDIPQVMGYRRIHPAAITMNLQYDFVIPQEHNRYIQEFILEYQEEIKRLRFNFNWEELRLKREDVLKKAWPHNLTKCEEGRVYVWLEEKQLARQSFLQYRRSKHKHIFSNLIFILGMFSLWSSVNLIEPLARIRHSILKCFGQS